MRDRRGVVYAETLLAFLPVFTFFAATLQLADLSAAQLVVQHASTTAARAAAVVLPDDGAYYGDRDNQGLHQFGGARQGDIEQAADLILRANGRLDATGANVGLDKSTYATRDDLTAAVSATYRCLLPIVCAGDLTLRSESKLVYQGAKFVYDPTTLGDVRPRRPPGGRPPVANDPNPDRPQDPDQRPPDDGDPRPPVADNDPPPRDGRPGQNDGNPRDPSDGRPRDPSDGRPRDPSDGRPPAVADNGRPPADNGRPPADGRPGNGRPNTPNDNSRPPAVADNGRPPADGRPGDGRPNDPVSGRPPETGKPSDGRTIDPGNGRPPAVADNGRPPATDKPSDGRTNDPVGRPPAVADNGRPPATDKPGAPALTPPTGAKDGLPVSSGVVGPIASVDPSTLPSNGSKGPLADPSQPFPPNRPGPVSSRPDVVCTSVVCAAPGQCFGAGTLVDTADGDRPIETVQVGDSVWSRDERTGALALKRVTRRFITEDAPVIDLELASAAQSELIKTTPDHPFYVRDLGWVAAGHLGDRSLLWSPEGSLVGHAGAAWGERTKVYNLEVEDFHTYFVGSLHAWVHNDCRGTDQAVELGWESANPDERRLPQGYEWVATAGGTPFVRRVDGFNGPQRFYNPQTGQFEVGGSDRRPTLQAGYVHQGLTPAESAELDRLRSTPRGSRTQADEDRLRDLTRRSEAVDFNEVIGVSIGGSQEARDLAARRNDTSLTDKERRDAAEELGERAADAFVAQAFPSSQPIYSGGGSGTADRVYRNDNPPPSFIVAEAKGGTATNDGSRQVGNERPQQGREDYLRDVLNDPRTIATMDAATRAELINALDNGEVLYIEVTQPVDASGGLPPMKVREYAPDSPRTRYTPGTQR